jgi:hypothetical protein
VQEFRFFDGKETVPYQWFQPSGMPAQQGFPAGKRATSATPFEHEIVAAARIPAMTSQRACYLDTNVTLVRNRMPSTRRRGAAEIPGYWRHWALLWSDA